MKLSEIKQVQVSKLKENHMNRQFFKTENADDFNALLDDISGRGIMVPLLAKQDGTLIAGHRRLRIARRLKMKTVPVMYVVSKLSAEEERELLITDNVNRRQMKPAERKAIYCKLIHKFDSKLAKPGRLSMTPREISEASGIPVSQIYSDLNKARKDKRDALAREVSGSGRNDRAVKIWNKAVSTALNAASIENRATVEAILSMARYAVDRLESMLANRKEAS